MTREAGARRWRPSPTRRCWWRRSWWRQGDAEALVSAGNTGACVLACAKNFRLIPGVRRAALATVYPTQASHGQKDDPFSLILDVGATVDASADDLVAFAVMGSAYARIISKNPNPTVALLVQRHRGAEGPAAGGGGEPEAGQPLQPGHALHRQRGGRRHPQGHRRRGGVRRLRRQRLPQDAGGRVRDGDGAGQVRLQGEAAVARGPGDALGRHRAHQGGHRLGAVRRARRSSGSTASSSRRTGARRRGPSPTPARWRRRRWRTTWPRRSRRGSGRRERGPGQ